MVKGDYSLVLGEEELVLLGEESPVLWRRRGRMSLSWEMCQAVMVMFIIIQGGAILFPFFGTLALSPATHRQTTKRQWKR